MTNQPNIPGVLPGGAPGLLNEVQAEVATEAAPLLTFVINNIRLIVAGLLVLVAATIGYGVWQWQQSNALREAQMELGRILVGPQSSKLAALEAFQAKAPAAMALGVQLEIASTAMQEDKPELAAQAYGRLHTADPNGVLGLMAAINQGNILRKSGKAEEALAVYAALQSLVPENMKPMVLEEMAASALQAGQKAKALELYESIVASAAATSESQNSTSLSFYKHTIAELKKELAAK